MAGDPGEDLRRFAAAAHAAANALHSRVRQALERDARQIGEQAVRDGADPMPRRGGLRARLGQAKVGVKVGGDQVDLTLSDVLGDSLGSLDQGRLFHPVFGRRHGLVEQRVQARTYTRALERRLPTVEARVREALQQTLDDVSRRA